MSEKQIDDMLVGRIFKKQYNETKTDIFKIIASKIKEKIDAKKEEFLNKKRQG